MFSIYQRENLSAAWCFGTNVSRAMDEWIPHECVFSFLGPREKNVPCSTLKWANVENCFLSIKAMKNRGKHFQVIAKCLSGSECCVKVKLRLAFERKSPKLASVKGWRGMTGFFWHRLWRIILGLLLVILLYGSFSRLCYFSYEHFTVSVVSGLVCRCF